LSTNNLLAGKAGQVIGTVFTTDKGRIIDHVQVAIRDTSLLLLTSPTMEIAFSGWIEKYTIMEDIHLDVVTESTSQFSLVGPKSRAFVEEATGVFLTPNQFIEIPIESFNVTVLYRNEFQTESVDFITSASEAATLWRFLTEYREGYEIIRIGAEAYEAFRISRGIPGIRSELSEAFNPYDVGLVHAINFSKGCYLGQEVIARIDTYQKQQNVMCGIVCDASPHAMHQGSSVSHEGNEIGIVTSVFHGMIRGKQLGITILKKNSAPTDDNVSILSDGNMCRGVVCPFPIVL
jgi:folate-binding protein YgfZ